MNFVQSINRHAKPWGAGVRSRPDIIKAKWSASAPPRFSGREDAMALEHPKQHGQAKISRFIDQRVCGSYHGSFTLSLSLYVGLCAGLIQRYLSATPSFN